MTLPHSEEAERAVISACLIAPVLPRALVHVSPEDFHLAHYRTVFEAQRRLWERDVKVDVVTLADELRATGELEQAGGFDLLAALIDGVPTHEHVDAHARVVAKHAARRRLIQAAAAVAERAHTGDDAEVSAALSHLIDTASPRKGGAGFRRAAEAVWPAMDYFDALQRGEAQAKGIATGFHDLDRVLIGFHPGDLIVVAGRPSMGKTAWVLNVLANVALNQGEPVALMSLEMSTEQVVQRLIASEGRVDVQALRRGHVLPREAHQRLAAGAGHISHAPFFVDDEPSGTLPQIAARLTQIVQREGVKLIAIDYAQLIEAPGAENRTQEVGKISRGLKLLAGRLKVPIILLSQLSRGPEQRADKRPMLSDLRESGAIEQDADVVMFLYRPEYYAPPEKKQALAGAADVIVAKQRNGPTGVVPMYFHAEYARFEDLAKDGRMIA